MHSFILMENIPDEIRSCGPEFLHKLSQLALELLSDRDEGEFSCPGVLGPLPRVVVVLEERPDEILLALLGNGFQTGVEGVIVLLYEVGRLEICIGIRTRPPTLWCQIVHMGGIKTQGWVKVENQGLNSSQRWEKDKTQG